MTHYETLGVAKDASTAEIKKAYRKLAMRFHPDRNPGNKAFEEKFKDINEAQGVLTDEDKRAEYDRQGASGNPFSFRFTHNGQPQDSFSTGSININDILADMLRRKMEGQYGGPSQKHWRVNISLQDAYAGTIVELEPGLRVNIPPGVRTGNRLVVNNDLITVVVQEHKKFKRTGDDLLVDAQLNAIDAILGTTARLAHLDGVTILKFSIDPGSQHGGVTRLRGKGMPNPELGTNGDLLIRYNIVIPHLTSKQKNSIMGLQSNIILDI